MTNRVLPKLFPPQQSINILQSNKEILPKIFSEKKCICSSNGNVQKHVSDNQDPKCSSMNTPIRNCPICSPYLCTRFTQYNLRNLYPGMNLLRKYNNLGVKLFDSSSAFLHTNSNGKLLLCTSFNEHALWNKALVISKGSSHQGQIQLYSQNSELQPVVSEGVGWDGQPIVKRTHAILPEVYGDVSDVFTALNRLQNSHNCENNQQTNDSTLLVQNINPLQVENSNSPKDQNSEVTDQVTERQSSSECLHKNINAEFENCYDQKEIQSCIKSHDNISLMNSSNKLSTPSVSVPITENVQMKPTEVRQPVTNFVEHLNRSEKNYFDANEYKEDIKPKIIMKKSKLKMKKKTKVVGLKKVKELSKVSMVRKKKSKTLGPRRNLKPKPQPVLCQCNKSLYYNSENVLLTENRQLMTDSALGYPRTSGALNKNNSKLTSDKNKHKTSNKGKKKMALDDCVCPETIEVKQKNTTKVCGEAAGAEKKEQKKRKPKMCIIEPIIKYRRKTFVCNSAAQMKGRRKQLPKCPEPEKKVAPRTEVCPPQLYDEAKLSAKKCVKQVEEVKIRKRSKVCKPVIIYAKEEASIKIEKTVCAESHVKQSISKYTKVCPPLNDKIEKPRRKRI